MSHCCYLSVSDTGSEGQYHIEGPERYTKCMGKCKYGPYCYKHRSLHLLKDGEIIPERFTGFAKDYLIQDLRNYCKKHKELFFIVLRMNPETQLSPVPLNDFGKSLKIFKKEGMFTIVMSIMRKVKFYKLDSVVSKTVRIQSVFRGFQARHKYRCNNDEDFFTFEPMKDIPSIYYFTYKDPQGFRWGFDLRSLKKLVEMGYPNPYTTEPIPPEVLQEIKERIQTLSGKGTPMTVVDEIVQDKTAIIKQKTVDLFSKIEQAGYSCNISWFLELDIPRLRELYKQLEDIWNYRSQLTREMRREICPPHGRVFSIPIVEIMNYPTKELLQECLLGEISKFSQSPIESNQKLGYMYFMIGLGYVSPPCFQTHQDWLAFIN
jgi:hypothetical protein